LKLKKTRRTTDITKHFSKRVVNRWNLLDKRTVDAPSLNAFKNSLSKISDNRMCFFMDYWTRSTKASLGWLSRREATQDKSQGKSHETIAGAGAHNTPESNKQTLATRRSYRTCCDVINDVGGTCIDEVHTHPLSQATVIQCASLNVSCKQRMPISNTRSCE